MPRSLLGGLVATTALAVTALTLGCSDASDPAGPDSKRNTTRSPADRTPVLTPQNSGTTERLIGIDAVNLRVAWASGVNGTYAVTVDGGRSWRAGVVPGAETLQFRDVEGISATEAYLLSIGNGTDSRIYHTTDGGATWELQFENQNPSAFYDCFSFWTPDRGFAFSDAVEGVFPVIRTTDGETWQLIADNLPPAQPGEAAFASSGTCTATFGEERGWIGTGGAEQARVIATTDGGETWTAYPTPIVQGTSAAGVFSLDFRSPTKGILAGGDLEREAEVLPNVATTSDGGQTWTLRTPFPFGTVFGLSYIADQALPVVFAVARAGVAWSPDEGGTWIEIPGYTDYWAVSFANPKAGWMVGGGGRIVKIQF